MKSRLFRLLSRGTRSSISRASPPRTPGPLCSASSRMSAASGLRRRRGHGHVARPSRSPPVTVVRAARLGDTWLEESIPLNSDTSVGDLKVKSISLTVTRFVLLAPFEGVGAAVLRRAEHPHSRRSSPATRPTSPWRAAAGWRSRSRGSSPSTAKGTRIFADTRHELDDDVWSRTSRISTMTRWPSPAVSTPFISSDGTPMKSFTRESWFSPRWRRRFRVVLRMTVFRPEPVPVTVHQVGRGRVRTRW